MKQFPRTDTLFIRCAPELKIALQNSCASWETITDVIHESIAYHYRNRGYKNHLSTLEEKLEFCQKLQEHYSKKEIRKRKNFDKKLAKEKSKLSIRAG